MKIALCGASSTGKTTLAIKLLENPFIKDFVSKLISVDGRQLLDLMGCNKMDKMNGNQTKEYQFKYFRNKIKSEYNQSNFITDRSYIDIASYWIVRDTFDASEKEQNKLLGPCRKLSNSYDLHFYMPFGLIEFEKDGYRPESIAFNQKIDKQIKLFLEKWDILHCKIEAVDIRERVETVITTINNIPTI